MNTHDKSKQEHDCNFRDELLAQRLAEILPTARVKQMGFLILILMDQSAWTIHQIAEDTFDLSGRLSEDGETTVDEMGIGQDRLELVLLKSYQKEKPFHETTNPFGSDPLGEKARTQERTLNESGMCYGSELFSYLKEVLPVQDHQCLVDDAGNFIVAVDALRIRVIPKGPNLYDVETFVGDKQEPKQVQLSHAETVRGVFDLVSAVERVNKIPGARASEDDEETDTEDTYEVLREMAGELGQPTDIFRNRSLFNLRSGLVLEGKNRSTTTNDLISGLDEHLQKFSTLKVESGERTSTDGTAKAKWFRGHPVSISGGMEGKTLAYVQNIGAVIVDKNDVPPSDALQLSWDAKAGVVMVPHTHPVRQPSWKPFR